MAKHVAAPKPAAPAAPAPESQAVEFFARGSFRCNGVARERGEQLTAADVERIGPLLAKLVDDGTVTGVRAEAKKLPEAPPAGA